MPYGRPFGSGGRAGLTWAPIESGIALDWLGIGFSQELNQFLAVGTPTGVPNANTAMTSTDGGLTWTVRVTPVRPFSVWTSVAWSNVANIWVAVADDPGNSAIMTSPNGVNWTLRAQPVIAKGYTTVRWIPAPVNLFVAGEGATAPGVDRFMTSPDGINWLVTATPNPGAFAVLGIAWSPTRNVLTAMIRPNLGAAWLSLDGGATWALTPMPAGTWNDVQWVPWLDLFVACDSTNVGTQIATSPDGVNWTLRATPVPATAVRNVCFSPYSRLIVCMGTNGVLVSTDAITWTKQAVPNINNWTECAYSSIAQRFIGVASGATGGNNVMYSGGFL